MRIYIHVTDMPDSRQFGPSPLLGKASQQFILSTMWCPSSIAKLVNITPTMKVFDTSNIYTNYSSLSLVNNS